MLDIKSDPIFLYFRKVNGKPLVYFDNGATSEATSSD
jgi:selenocysteine lyase/cysteine desulfurase